MRFTIDNAIDALMVVSSLRLAADAHEKQARAFDSDGESIIGEHFAGLANHARSLAKEIGKPWGYT